MNSALRLTSATGAQQAARGGSQASPSSRGVSALMYACQQGDVERVRRILRAQPDSHLQKDRTGKTSLHYCCCSDNICSAQAADLLVMAAPDLVESTDEDGFTPLHLAVIAGNMPLVTFLLANKADVNAVDNEKHTVVHWAAVCGETVALRAVLAAGAPVSTPDVHGGYPLHYAAQMCGGVKLNERDSELGLQVLHTLLSHQDVIVSVEDGDGRQPLLWAASAGSSKAVLALVRAGASVEAPDKDGLTALHCAASRGHTDCIDTLLTLCGASPDIIDCNGCTALHYSVTLGHADATALLLAHGADTNRQDRKGRSPAHCGCAKGQFETVKMIGAHGGNLWLRNARGDLPLHEAAASGRRDLVKWLLEARPSQVNARNNDGRCPLHLAALNDNADMCKILLDAGAQINPILRTSKNIFMTPLDCAMQRGFRSTAKYLQLHGGVPANRLRGLRQDQVTSAVSLHIRDDVTFWGSTSDSERENADNSNVEQPKKRSYRKKLAYKYERKKESMNEKDLGSSTKEEDKKKLKRKVDGKNGVVKTERTIKKSGREKISYSSEVKLGTTKIQANDEFTVTCKSPKTLTVPSQVSEKDKQSAEKEKRPKSAKLRTKSSRKSPTVETDKRKSKSVTPPSEHKEVVSKSTSTEDSIIVQNETEQHKKEDVAIKTQHVQTEIDLPVVTIQTHEVDEKKSSYKSAVQPDQQSLLSNTSYEDADEQKKLVVEAAVHSPPKEVEIKTESVPLDIHVETETVKVEESRPEEDSQIVKKEEAIAEVLLKAEAEIEASVDEVKMVSSEVTKDSVPDKILEENAKEKQEKIEDKIADDVKEEKFIDVINTEEKSELKENDDLKQEVENIQKTVQNGLEKNEELSSTKTVDENSSVIELAKDKEKKLDNGEKTEGNGQANEKAFEILEVAETKQDQSEESGEMIKVNEESDVKTYNDFVKTTSSRRKRMTIPKNSLQIHHDSADTKSSEEDNSSTISTQSSNTSKKTHRSFTVLDDDASDKPKIQIRKSRKTRTPLKKARSRSEENRSSSEMKREKERLKRSKIPMPLNSRAAQISKSDRHLDRYERRTDSAMDSFIPSLPNIPGAINGDAKHLRSESNMSAPLAPSVYSDNERGSGSDLEEITSSARKRRVKKRTKSRGAKSAGSDYESSNLIDSGFEPSPRSSRIPKWKNMSERGVNMSSVTQSIQSNIRRYHLERKIFQHLLELKRLQIRSGQHNETILVKRAIDAYHQSCAATVGAGRYVAEDFTFKSFEKFLYYSLRKLQKNGADHLKGLPESSNPLLCTQSTHRCSHATHAYTGVPCAAYLPKMDHHTIPKIGFSCKPSGFLPKINQKKAVTLELCHGNDKQVISLPADRLDQNKRYYVTFTVKGQEEESSKDSKTSEIGHRHAKSD